MTTHRVVSPEEWIGARLQHLAREKELTRLRDELSRERRELPWVRVEKPYVFDGPRGQESLPDLFEGRSQLVVQHFMFDPSWGEGCKSCSFWADNFDGITIHLNHRDVSFALVSRAPIATLEAYRQRMGWHVKWVSSFHTDFNRDFHVSFTPEEARERAGVLQLRRGILPGARGPRHQRVLQGHRRGGVSHLFLLRPRARHAERRLSPPGFGSEGARRGGLDLLDGVAPPPRPVRGHAAHPGAGVDQAGASPGVLMAGQAARLRGRAERRGDSQRLAHARGAD